MFKCKHKRLKDFIKVDNLYIQYCENCNKAVVVKKVEEFCQHKFVKVDKIKKQYCEIIGQSGFTALYIQSPVMTKEILILKCDKCGMIKREE